MAEKKMELKIKIWQINTHEAFRGLGAKGRWMLNLTELNFFSESEPENVISVFIDDD